MTLIRMFPHPAKLPSACLAALLNEQKSSCINDQVFKVAPESDSAYPNRRDGSAPGELPKHPRVSHGSAHQPESPQESQGDSGMCPGRHR